jgi:hypothetical protein
MNLNNEEIAAVKAELNNLSANKYINSEEAKTLVAELINLSLNCQEPIDSEYREVFLAENNKPRVKQIGEKLHELGGHNLMIGAWQSIPKHDQLELTYAWDGVGVWEV